MWPLSATSTASSARWTCKTGKILWQTRLGTTVQGYPVSFSVDGKQYIAVTTGLGGGSPQPKPGTMLTRSAPAAERPCAVSSSACRTTTDGPTVKNVNCDRGAAPAAPLIICKLQ